MATRAKITGTGMYVPERVVTNHDLAKLIDTSDEWIQKRTGIVERHFISEGQSPVDLAQAASERALASANLEPADIDCIVLATLSAQAEFPGTSFFLPRIKKPRSLTAAQCGLHRMAPSFRARLI